MSLVSGLEEGFNPFSDSSSESSVSIVEPPQEQISEQEEAGVEPSAPEIVVAAESKPEPVAPAPATKKEDAPPDKWVKHFEKLSAKELAQRQKDKELAAKEAELGRAAKIMELANKGARLDVLRELGISIDDVLTEHLNGGRPDPDKRIAALEAKIAQLEGTTTEVTKHTKETQQAYFEDIGNRWDRDFEYLLEKPEYKFIKDIPGKIKDIQSGVVGYYNQTKKLLPPQQALDIVVKELRSNYEALHKHLSPAAAPASTEPVAKTSGPKTMSPKLNAMPRYSYPTDTQEEFAELIAKHTRR